MSQARISVKRYDTPTAANTMTRENRFTDAGDVINIDMSVADIQLTARLDRTGALSLHVFIQGIEVSTFRRPDRLRVSSIPDDGPPLSPSLAKYVEGSQRAQDGQYISPDETRKVTRPPQPGNETWPGGESAR